MIPLMRQAAGKDAITVWQVRCAKRSTQRCSAQICFSPRAENAARAAQVRRFGALSATRHRDGCVILPGASPCAASYFRAPRRYACTYFRPLIFDSSAARAARHPVTAPPHSPVRRCFAARDATVRLPAMLTIVHAQLLSLMIAYCQRLSNPAAVLAQSRLEDISDAPMLIARHAAQATRSARAAHCCRSHHSTGIRRAGSACVIFR